MRNVSSNTLLLHAVDDDTIPHSHSAAIFQSLKPQGVRETSYPGWGIIRRFKRPGGSEVVWWEGDAGGHNHLGWSEGSMDLIKDVACL